MSYTKECNVCRETIRMDNVGGAWKAYSVDGSEFHKCKNNEQKAKVWIRGVMQGADKDKTTVAPQREDLSLEERVEEMDKRLMRVQKILDAFIMAGVTSGV